MTDKITNLYLKRIEKFMKRITDRILVEYIPFEARFYWSKEPVPFEKRLEGKYKSIQEGEIWGKTWESAWFHLQATVPESWKGKKVVAQLDFEGEGLVVLPNGYPIQGITHNSIFDDDFKRDIVHLYDCAKGGEKVELWVEAAANSLFGVFLDEDPPADDPNRFGHYEGKTTKMRLCVFDDELWHLRLDFDILLGLVKTLPEKSVRRARIFRTLNEAIDAFADDPANVASSREILKREMNKPASVSDLSATAVGHSHIDTGWLWPVRETIRKAMRTFSSQVTLLEKYPTYVFGASQPQHYQFVKEYCPVLYEKIKQFVKAGRWECQGGMWVEADCNLISGESMVRQILHGKNFFRDEFEVDVNNLWLPDVFGYSAAMPQILAKSGIEFFLTQKLSWSLFNEFPYHTFMWRGIDGTEVLTHFPPENTYNSHLHPKSLVPGRDNFKEKDFIDEFICLFGIGDGGGGPKEMNIEYGLRIADLEGCPRVTFGKASDFFERLRKYKDQLSTWAGELYLEAHRGTLTSQALVKKLNRQLEYKLREVEFLWSCLPFEKYPVTELDAIWKKVLINQFHDILPGSSINAVYKVTHAEYQDALEKCTKLVNKAATLLFEADENSLVLFNTLSYPYQRPIVLPADWDCAVIDEEGQSLPIQKEEIGNVVQINMPAQCFLTLQKTNDEINRNPITQNLLLENEYIRYEFDKEGKLVQAFDKESKRQVLAPDETGNVLALYNDLPHQWDAWDVDIYYEGELLETAQCTEARKIADGPVRQGIQFELTIGHSAIEQRVYLASNSKRLDFQTRVNWNEQHKMLRVSFPVNVYAEQASFDIQYGYLKRNTHRNTSWDLAKFEVAAHRYVDLSDHDYGVALLNDCKYGHKVHNNILDLNLLRSPRNPDPDADQGMHEFTYSLLPHIGNLIQSTVMAEAAQLNQAISLFAGYRTGTVRVPCQLEGEGLSLEVVKKAEKENCLILRIVETSGRHSNGKLIFTKAPVTLIETNLLEWTNEKEITCEGSFNLQLKPFEILTLKCI